MELKPRLQDYTEREFLEFTRRIAAVDVKKQDHDRLIEHFDTIVECPDAIDLIFHPARMEWVQVYAPSIVLRIVADWCATNGKPGPKPDGGVRQTASSIAPRPPIPFGFTAAAKLARSRQQLEQGQALAAEAGRLLLSANLALDDFEQRVAQVESLPFNSEPLLSSQMTATALPDHVDDLLRMELRTILQIHDFARMEIRIDMFHRPAKSNLSSALYDSETQALVLQDAQALKTQFTSQLSALKSRQITVQQKVADYLVAAHEQMMLRMSFNDWGPGKVTSTLTAMPSNIAQRPCLLSADDEASHFFEPHNFSFQQSLRSVIAEFNWIAETKVDEKQVHSATLLQFHSVMGNRERFGVSAPLVELVQIDTEELQGIAAANAQVNVPVRIGFGETSTGEFTPALGTRKLNHFCTVYAAACTKANSLSSVRVRAASWCSERRGYCFTTSGQGATTLVWRKAGSVDDPQVVILDPAIVPPRLMSIHTYQTPIVEKVVSTTDLNFEDYVIVFPRESLLEPVYVAIKGCQDLPGVASGVGEDVIDDWLQREPLERDAAIPASVAQRLRGRVFSKFSEFRRAFWIEVSQDEGLKAQFTDLDLAAMRGGNGPSLGAAGPSGTSAPFELYHVDPVSEDGDAYDMDNMSVMTDAQHAEMIRLINEFDS